MMEDLDAWVVMKKAKSNFCIERTKTLEKHDHKNVVRHQMMTTTIDAWIYENYR